MPERERNAAIADYRANFPAYLEKVFSFPLGEKDSVAMLGASFYVLRLGGVTLAVDPYIKTELLPSLPVRQVEDAFAKLDGVLLTHRHRDHYDKALIALLKALPLKWYVPRFFGPEETDKTFGTAQTVTVDTGARFLIRDVEVTPFDSPHSDPARNTVTPEYGYLLESGGRRFLMPGDVRVYDPALVPRFTGIDTLFLHVWLGAKQALLPPFEPKMAEMCAFAASFAPGRIILGHLYEFDRRPEDMWTAAHTALAESRLIELLPRAQVITARLGEVIAV